MKKSEKKSTINKHNHNKKNDRVVIVEITRLDDMSVSENDTAILINNKPSGGPRGRKFGVEGAARGGLQNHHSGDHLVDGVSPVVGYDFLLWWQLAI